MVKKNASIICAALIALSITACKKIDGETSGGKDSAQTTQQTTRIANTFKGVLPRFDGEISENYKEGISYSFSAECSKGKFEKYVEKVKKAGFVSKASEGEGYYAAYSEEGYYTEMTLVNGNATVFIKRK